MIQIKKKILTLVALLAVTTGAWADDYTITLPTVSNGSVVAKVNDASVTSAAAGATVSLVATPDAGCRLKTISGTYQVNPQETLSKGAATRTGNYFTLTASNSVSAGWTLYSSSTITISRLDGGNISTVVLNITPRASFAFNEMSVNHGSMTRDGNTITISGINSSSVVITGTSRGGAYGCVVNSAQITGTGTLDKALSLTSTGDDNVNTFTMPSSNVTVSAEFEEIPLEVAWTAASKSGSFTMPGGNVELEPEYYPQAALTAQPTAINDVAATTDGAIVKAGTVKNIGETTTAQGTVMYYVSPTALDDAALLALAADQWTADVPTAESLAQGQAYVYYYVRGNDGDTDETTFSDGDILAANALTVNIAAAPTYAVTFADDLAEPTKWTATPNTDVTKGQTVTVTYTGTKKVLGVKAEKKASTVPVTTITLNKTETSIKVGATETLSVSSVTPDDATDQTVTWSSDNEAAATVNATTGEVTAVAVGTANITATANDGSGVTATCAVTVTPAVPEYYDKLTKINDAFMDQVNKLKGFGRGYESYNSSLTAAQAYALATYQAAIDGKAVYVIMSSQDSGYEIHYAVSTDASATEHTADLYDICNGSNRMYYVAQ